jgi:hypothetical protein
VYTDDSREYAADSARRRNAAEKQSVGKLSGSQWAGLHRRGY